jgi:hypothetical protein
MIQHIIGKSLHGIAMVIQQQDQYGISRQFHHPINTISYKIEKNLGWENKLVFKKP